jgi:hypothetical protein
MPAIPAFWRLRQEDGKLKTSITSPISKCKQITIKSPQNINNRKTENKDNPV